MSVLSNDQSNAWSELATELTTRSRTALLGALRKTIKAEPASPDVELLESFAAVLDLAQVDGLSDWSVLRDDGPLSRDALLVRLGQIDRLMDRYPNDFDSGTNGLLIALLRFLKSDPELYARALATARVAVESAAHSEESFS